MQRAGGFVFAIGVGLLVAWFAYDRVTDPDRGVERQLEERVVLAARGHLEDILALGPAAEIVDPLAPNRVAGKVYVYPKGEDWEVSGYYRRQRGTEWLPWLMSLDATHALTALRLPESDAVAARLAGEDPRISIQ